MSVRYHQADSFPQRQSIWERYVTATFSHSPVHLKIAVILVVKIKILMYMEINNSKIPLSIENNLQQQLMLYKYWMYQPNDSILFHAIYLIYLKSSTRANVLNYSKSMHLIIMVSFPVSLKGIISNPNFTEWDYLQIPY